MGDAASPERFEAALLDVLGYAGDPIGKVEAALAADPDLVLGHLLRAHIFLFALQPGFAAKAATSLEAARDLMARGDAARAAASGRGAGLGRRRLCRRRRPRSTPSWPSTRATSPP